MVRVSEKTSVRVKRTAWEVYGHPINDGTSLGPPLKSSVMLTTPMGGTYSASTGLDDEAFRSKPEPALDQASSCSLGEEALAERRHAEINEGVLQRRAAMAASHRLAGRTS